MRGFKRGEKQMRATELTSSRENTVLVWILGCAGLVSAADNWIVVPILPSISDGLGVSIAKGAMILTAYMIPYGVLQPVHGYLSERCGRLKLLRWLMIGLGFGMAGCACSSSLVWLCVFRFVAGLAAAGMIAVSLALIGDRVPTSVRQKYVGLFMGIVFLGQGISVGFGGLLGKFVSWRIIFLLFAFATLGVDALLYLLQEDLPNRTRSSFIAEIIQAVSSRRGLVIYSLALVTGFFLLGIYGFTGAFLQRRGGLDPLQSGCVLMFYGFGCLMAGSSAGWISGLAGTRGTIMTGATCGLSAAVMLTLSADWRIGWLAVTALGLGYVFIQSTLATLAFDEGSNGVSAGMVGLGLFGGGGLSSAFGGLILAHYSYEALWCALGAGLAIMIPSVAILRNGVISPMIFQENSEKSA